MAASVLPNASAPAGRNMGPAGLRVSPLEEIDQAIYALAELMRDCQRADVCMITMSDAHGQKTRLYRADEDLDASARGGRVEGELGRLLLTPPQDLVIFNRRGLSSGKASCHHPVSLAPRKVDAVQLIEVANLLATDSFVSVPLSCARPLGRVHIGSRQRGYGMRELRAAAYVAKRAGVMIENTRLAGRLALEVASEERKRISRDLHDSTMQPYIGLKLGLEALRRKVDGISDLAHELDELIKIAGDGISELREYVGQLKRAEVLQERQAGSLLPAVRSQSQKFTEFYGIRTRVLAEKDIPVTGAMHGEILHIVREGLSNIRRHTTAAEATLRLREARGRLLLEFINDTVAADGRPPRFFPRSIGERAKELGGRVKVQHRAGGYTVVTVDLPL